jgi:hypothetical protein
MSKCISLYVFYLDRVLDQFGKEQVSANNPGKELADQSGHNPVPVSISDQPPKKLAYQSNDKLLLISAEHQSVKKRADQLAKEHPAKELANRSGGKPASVFEQFPKKPASVSKQSPKCSKKPVAVSISSQSTKNNVSVSVARESADPTPCLVFENVFEKSVVIAFDESVKKVGLFFIALLDHYVTLCLSAHNTTSFISYCRKILIYL